MARKNINLIKLFYLFLLCFFSIIGVSEAENKLLMITDKSCLYCIIWEKQIGKIYPKTDIAKNYSLYRMEINEFKKTKNSKPCILMGYYNSIILSKIEKPSFMLNQSNTVEISKEAKEAYDILYKYVVDYRR